MSEYETKAQAFLDKFGLKFRATMKGDCCPPYCGEDGRGCVHGDRYRVTIWRGKGGRRLSFDFWNSLNDCQQGKEPTAYNVLACISSNVNCPDTFGNFCREYGYDADSRKAFATFKRCATFAEQIGRASCRERVYLRV